MIHFGLCTVLSALAVANTCSPDDVANGEHSATQVHGEHQFFNAVHDISEDANGGSVLVLLFDGEAKGVASEITRFDTAARMLQRPSLNRAPPIQVLRLDVADARNKELLTDATVGLDFGAARGATALMWCDWRKDPARHYAKCEPAEHDLYEPATANDMDAVLVYKEVRSRIGLPYDHVSSVSDLHQFERNNAECEHLMIGLFDTRVDSGGAYCAEMQALHKVVSLRSNVCFAVSDDEAVLEHFGVEMPSAARLTRSTSTKSNSSPKWKVLSKWSEVELTNPSHMAKWSKVDMTFAAFAAL